MRFPANNINSHVEGFDYESYRLHFGFGHTAV